MSTNKDELSPKKTFSFTYSTGEEVTVKRVPWSLLDDITELQTQIIKYHLEANGFLGSLLSPSNKKFWSAVKKLASLMPVVGQEKPGINVDLIEDEEELLRIFVTNTLDIDNEYGQLSFGENSGGFKPGEISRINGLNFYEMSQRVAKMIAKDKMANQQQPKEEAATNP